MKKVPYAMNSSLRDYVVEQDETVKATVKESNSLGDVGYYVFDVEIDKDGQVLKLGMKSPAGVRDSRSPYTLTLFKSASF